ncbi:MAG: VOC family protein [Anaerolineales bacterium]
MGELNFASLIAFLPTTDPARARLFYEGELGLTFIADEPFALVFHVHGARLRITKVASLTPQPFTVLGWQVPDLRASVRDLKRKGIRFELYPPLAQDADGVCTFPDGTQVAWFKDPDGNVLSVTQFPHADSALSRPPSAPEEFAATA